MLDKILATLNNGETLQAGASPVVLDNKNETNFGQITKAEKSKTVHFLFLNKVDNVTYTSTSVPGGVFVENSTTCNKAIAAPEECEIVVTFTPPAEKQYSTFMKLAFKPGTIWSFL